MSYLITVTETIEYTQVIDREEMNNLLAQAGVDLTLIASDDALDAAVSAALDAGDLLRYAGNYDAMDHEWVEHNADVQGQALTVTEITEETA